MSTCLRPSGRCPLSLLVLSFAALAATAAPRPAAALPTARVDLPGLHRQAQVLRDGRGIPHLVATDEHDLFFLQGYVDAEDRLFQMDTLRRQASGTLAELLGPAALSSDVELRTLGLRRAAERSWAALTAATQDDLVAYCDGVNAWVASHPLPPEYGLLELTSFAPWDVIDSVAIGKLIAFGLSFDLDVDATVTLATYQAAGAVGGFDGTALYFDDVFRSAPFDPATTVIDAVTGAPGRVTAAAAAAAAAAETPPVAGRLRPRTLELARRVRDRARAVPLLAGALAPRDRDQGSNEFAVAGHLTSSGRPIIANDPHLALDTPATFHQVHLRAPAVGIDVMGSSFPGVPYVVLGQNPFISWGATTNPMDVTDVYQETIVADAASPSGLSTVYQGNEEPIVPLPVTFRVNQLDGRPDDVFAVPPGGGVPAVVLIVPRRNQGPILDLDTDAGVGLSVQYTGFSATRELDTFRAWLRARDLADFEAALRTFDVGSQNWVYGDVAGNIAYFTSAEMPLREDLEAGGVDGLPPFFIRDGTGGNEWLPAGADRPADQAIPYAVLPMDEMPHLVNPPAGWFVNANNDPVGTTLDNNPLNQPRETGGLFYLNPGYDAGTRAGRITQRVKQAVSAGGMTFAEAQSIQADVVLLDAQVLAPQLVAAYDHVTAAPGAPAVSAAVGEAIDRLRGWDFSTPTGLHRGFDAADVDGVRGAPSAAEKDASVAATIYSVWRGQVVRDVIDAPLAARGLPLPGSRGAIIALRHLLDRFDAAAGVGASGVDFFPQPAAVADRPLRRDVVLLGALQKALDLLASDTFAPAFGHSGDQSTYRWGRLHRIVFDHPLGPPLSIPAPGSPLGLALGSDALPGIPTDGGFGTVDASSHSVRADGPNEFMFGSGPVRRYVGMLGDHPAGTEAVTALPGGESGVPGSPDSANLLPLWLTDDAYPVVQWWGDLVGAATQRTIYRP